MCNGFKNLLVKGYNKSGKLISAKFNLSFWNIPKKYLIINIFRKLNRRNNIRKKIQKILAEDWNAAEK
jgi:hypothetical protein